MTASRGRRGTRADRRRRPPVAALTAVAGLALAGAGLAGGASAANPPVTTPAPSVAVPQGLGPAELASTPPFGTTPLATPVTVSFVLRARNLAALEQAVESGDHAQLSVAEFAAEYGQTPQVIAAIEGYLGEFGIATNVVGGDLDIVANGTAGEFDRALSVVLDEYNVPARQWGSGATTPGQQVYGTTEAPRVPATFASDVLSVLGLTNYEGAFSSSAVKALRPAGVAPVTGGATSLPAGELTPADFESDYDVTPLYGAGDLGQGQTIGIVTFASVDPQVPYTFWTKYLHLKVSSSRLALVNVDGGSGPVSLAAGSDETTLDTEQSGAIAPDANIVVYQAPNTDYGAVDALFAAAGQDVAGSISESWGSSETIYQLMADIGTESSTFSAAQDEGLLELAMQGEAFFASSGDSGAYPAAADAGTTNLSVANPADSPYVTAAGGTTLPGVQSYPSPTGGAPCTLDVRAQRTWGWDYLWACWSVLGGTSEASFAVGAIGGSGGGFSVDEPTPSYQSGVRGTGSYTAVPYLNPTAYTNTYEGVSLGNTYVPTAWNVDLTPPVIGGGATGRALPDLSVNADPQTGYALYDPQFTGENCGTTAAPVACPPVLQYGGTSFSAPQLNAVAALIDDYVGHWTGLWNPAIYGFAASARSPFTPLDTPGTSNDNLFYSGTPGALYNPGSGLGTPDVFALANDFR